MSNESSNNESLYKILQRRYILLENIIILLDSTDINQLLFIVATENLGSMVKLLRIVLGYRRF